ncbi:MAG: DUF1801 domain-containing protein [Flavobacteriales bacterium]|nr:DUF1801 domain-containing protein [Flavobacteriales bacterium]
MPAAKSAKPTRKADLNDWRDDTLARMRTLIREADPGISEEQKWKKPSNPAGVPVWSHGGIICTGEIYKDKVKLTFMHGAALPDPTGLFNAPGTGGTRRAIDIREGEKVERREESFAGGAAIRIHGSQSTGVGCRRKFQGA